VLFVAAADMNGIESKRSWSEERIFGKLRIAANNECNFRIGQMIYGTNFVELYEGRVEDQYIHPVAGSRFSPARNLLHNIFCNKRCEYSGAVCTGSNLGHMQRKFCDWTLKHEDGCDWGVWKRLKHSPRTTASSSNV
jgi:hypothetical protein